MDDRTVILKLTPMEADRFTAGVSDLLCWVRGFMAALPEDKRDTAPFGHREARELNERLIEAFRAARIQAVKGAA